MEDYADDAAALLETVMPERQNLKGNMVALSWTSASDDMVSGNSPPSVYYFWVSFGWYSGNINEK